MELTEDDLVMLLISLDGKLGGFDHIGMRDSDPIKIGYQDLRRKVRAELNRKRYGS